jgi:hypothetical protein
MAGGIALLVAAKVNTHIVDIWMDSYGEVNIFISSIPHQSIINWNRWAFCN